MPQTCAVFKCSVCALQQKMSQKSSGSVDKDSGTKENYSGSLKAESESQEAINLTNYDEIVTQGEEQRLPPKTGEFYFQDYKYVRPTQSAFERQKAQGAKLFDQIKQMTTDNNENVLDITPSRDPSILISGFGMRNVESFQEILRMSHEERRKYELKKMWRDEQAKQVLQKENERRLKTDVEAEGRTARTDTTELSTSTKSDSARYTSDLCTQTETASGVPDQKKHLDYLLGLEADIEEEGQATEIQEEDLEEPFIDQFKYSSAKSIREAQKYLRTHRIFECFQFIISHLLSAHTDNPIDFIINLLNKCLLYRSGLGAPPLLYEKKHINQLFNLMDRLQMGYIEYRQYKTGMTTLGICSFNENPVVNQEDLITQDTFVEEAYNAELALFDDMIRRRVDKSKSRSDTSLSYDSISCHSVNPPYFIPSELFKYDKLKISSISNAPPDYSEDAEKMG